MRMVLQVPDPLRAGRKEPGLEGLRDSIVHADGPQAQDPIGTCEMQAFVYASKLRFSQMLYLHADKELARKFHHEPQELRKKFNDVFWMDQEGYIAMGIDSKKRLIKCIASDPGQCLIHGIVDQSLVPRVTQ